jgi:hypothetical protein
MLAHPNDVEREDIEAEVAKQEQRIASHHRIEGLVFPIWIDRIGGGHARRAPKINAVADVALFNGIYLMGLVAKYGATSDPAVLRELGASIDALYKLTHITGMPGLLTRYALPLARAIESDVIPTPGEAGTARASYRHIYYRDPQNVRPEYSHLQNIVAGGQSGPPIARSPAGRLLTGHADYGDQYLCTRTSRDQLTGVVFGLAFAMKCFEEERRWAADRPLGIAIRRTLSRTAVDLYQYLREHRWRMVDPVTGSGARTSGVSGLLRTAVELLFRRALMNQWADASWRDDAGPSLRRQLEWFRHDTRGSGLPLRIEPRLRWLGAMWPWTTRYYVWHLRLLRLVSILVLDDLHPRCLADPPEVWPAHTLTRSATTRRNRAWLGVFEKAFWRCVGSGSNPWLTYLFNRLRAEVLVRHLDDPAAVRTPGGHRDVYAVSGADVDRMAEVAVVQDARLLRRALFGSLPSIGCELPRAHFHLRSLAIKPWRSHSTPWAMATGPARERLRTPRPRPVYPPHLMKFTTNFICEKDPTVAPSIAEDPVGRSERMLIDLPVLYWTIVEDGQWRSQWASFPSSAFTPPGDPVRLTPGRLRARWSGWGRARATPELS